MTVSVRSYLTAGVAAMAASAVVMAPVSATSAQSITAGAVRLSAAVQPLLQPVSAAVVLGTPTPALAAATTAAIPQAAATAKNAASDFVINAWNFADYWISYGTQLAQWALGWVWPLSLIGDQAPLLWYNLGQPIGDAAVYGLIAPVLNDPLNPAVWGAGLTVLAQTTVLALINTAVAEFNYFIGWIIPPLPPLPFPPLPLAAVAPAAAAKAGTAVASAASADPSPRADAAPSGTGHSGRTAHVGTVQPAAAASSVDATSATVDAADQGTVDAAPAPTGTSKTTAKATAAPGAVADDQDSVDSGAKQAEDTANKPRSTARSGRGHGRSASGTAHDAGQ